MNRNRSTLEAIEFVAQRAALLDLGYIAVTCVNIKHNLQDIISDLHRMEREFPNIRDRGDVREMLEALGENVERQLSLTGIVP